MKNIVFIALINLHGNTCLCIHGTMCFNTEIYHIWAITLNTILNGRWKILMNSQKRGWTSPLLGTDK